MLTRGLIIAKTDAQDKGKGLHDRRLLYRSQSGLSRLEVVGFKVAVWLDSDGYG
jgi:hypothetical protein